MIITIIRIWGCKRKEAWKSCDLAKHTSEIYVPHRLETGAITNSASIRW
jgi:hypothetical protein